MDQKLKDKTVLITGASSGIGWATAVAFAKRKCRLALAARRVEKLQELSQKVLPPDTQTLEIPCDVTNAEQVKWAVQKTINTWERIDILINNAGISDYRPFMDQDLSTIEKILNTNLMGTLYMIHAVLPMMKKQGSGHIVNVASVAGHLGVPNMAVYCASKFGMVGLTQALRMELYKTGITLTALCPGTVATPMAEKALRNPKLAKRLRPKSADQVAELIVKSCVTKPPEIIYGEIPGTILKLTKFFPRLTDWLTYTAVKIYRPFGKSN